MTIDDLFLQLIGLCNIVFGVGIGSNYCNETGYEMENCIGECKTCTRRNVNMKYMYTLYEILDY